MQYRAPLDGLRALCAGAVFFFHASYGRGGGFVGVDIFFVLSGYLITRILLQDIKDAGGIRFRRFYLRRARRLLPAVFVALVLTFAVWRWVGDGGKFVSILPPVLLYYVNWCVAFNRNIPGLPHFWSLSTEEQFYLVWPILLSGVYRWGHRALVVAIGGLIVAFASARALAPDLGPTIAALFGYYSTLARADELLMGALVAVLHTSPSPDQRERMARVARLLAWPAMIALGAFLIGASVYSVWQLRAGFTGVAAAAALVVVHCASGEPTRFNRLLETPVLVAWGKRSYGIYVFHFPIIHALEPLRTHGAGNWVAVTLLRAAATLALAWISYKFVESRFLTSRVPVSDARVAVNI